MGGANNSGSPTSNLFPSITSLFQSPIGTPRVTPTPQHFAAYLFNDDQFHSFILSNNAGASGNGGSSSGGNGPGNSNAPSSSDVFLDAVLLSNASNLSSQSSSNLLNNFSMGNELNMSPLPLFNNLISNSLNGGHSNHGLMNTSELSSNTVTNAGAATTPATNAATLLSANN